MNTKRICASLALGTVMISGLALAETGPFTQQQAEDGHAKFNNYCAQCHRPDLSGGQGPALTGDQFKAKWGGKSVAELRDFIHANMPKTAPHSLTNDKLDPIVAWILSKNGDQGGDKPLSKDSAETSKVPK
ncbi:MAG: cytochrome c [Steroidobacteraceae bacterium]